MSGFKYSSQTQTILFAYTSVVSSILLKHKQFCLHTDKWFQVFFSNTNNSVCTQISGFKFSSLKLIILFDIHQLFAHSQMGQVLLSLFVCLLFCFVFVFYCWRSKDERINSVLLLSLRIDCQ